MLTIKSHFCNYHVQFVEKLSDVLTSLANQEKIFYLIDKKFYSLYENFFKKLPSSKAIQIEATERQKSFEALQPLVLNLLEAGIKRDNTLVVIGGGITQDIGCFIASVLMRGIKWIFIPTTLLAQADSCIGSKSSINISSYKNMIGTFYPPKEVFIITSLLKTLTDDDFCSGIGEIIKFQLLSEGSGYGELIKEVSIIKENQTLLKKWIERSLDIKKSYIESDEFDQGRRNLLNYGHTFGHAYESATNYEIPHGIAVIMGIITASLLSLRLGMISNDYFNQLKSELMSWCENYFLILKKIKIELVIKAIKHDKKQTSSEINCILTSGLGQMKKTLVSLEDDVVPVIFDFISGIY